MNSFGHSPSIEVSYITLNIITFTIKRRRAKNAIHVLANTSMYIYIHFNDFTISSLTIE